MTEMQLQNVKNSCNGMVNAYKSNISELLSQVARVKGVEIENAKIKEDLDTILEDIERKLKSLEDEMNVSL